MVWGLKLPAYDDVFIWEYDLWMEIQRVIGGMAPYSVKIINGKIKWFPSKPRFGNILNVAEVRVSSTQVAPQDINAVTCESLQYPWWTLTEYRDTNNAIALGCSDSRFTGNYCNISCKSVLSSDYCENNMICRPTKERVVLDAFNGGAYRLENVPYTNATTICKGPSVPLNFHATWNQNMLTLHWDCPDLPGGPLEYFRITLRQFETEISANK
ncbi:hypothetical protein CBL_01876 [Carabus blaptoides fortunei]